MRSRLPPLLLVLAALTALGCEKTYQMEIVGVLGPTPPECALDPIDTPVLDEGILDLRADGPRYLAPLVVKPTWNLTLNAARVFFTDGNLRSIDGLPTVNHARAHPVEGELASGERQVFELEIVSEDDVRTIRQSLGGGLIDDGDEVRMFVWITFAGTFGELSNELAFPIDVCHGCLIGTGTVDGEVCADENEVVVEREVCRVGQDEIFSSCEPPPEGG